MDTFKVDQITSEACKMFNQLPKKGKPNTSTEWTTMSAIIEEKASESNQSSVYKVISIGTGTKCLGKSELSPNGDVVSDCHAEVVARRSFLLYLYEQVSLHKSSQISLTQNSILELINPDEKTLKHNLKLKEGVKFHMFISHLPCGDASIIEEQFADHNEDLPSESKRIKLDDSVNQGGHRTGAKLQVGPLQYEEKQAVGKCRVKPGKGDPTLCMSCSDKLAKWQILGLQGALLSVFIPSPIRLDSIVIGSDVSFSKESLERAIFKRFADFESISTLRCTDNFPIFMQSSQNFMKFSEKLVPAPASISWHYSAQVADLNEKVEVVVGGRKQGATKKSFGKPSSMVNICRAKIFSKFKELYSEDSNEVFSFNYNQSKLLSENYFKSWTKLKEQVFKGWTNKPDELQQFI